MSVEKKYFEKEVYSNKDYKYKFLIDKDIIKKITSFKKKGTILDIGCGDSGTSISLAKSGYNVTCIDISKSLIKNLKDYANEKNIKIKAICKDIEKYKFTKKYDIIIMTGILHFISKDKIYSFINNIKKNTKNNGINIICAFRDKDISQDNTSEGYYFRDKELFDFYIDWDIKIYEEYIEDKHKVVDLVAIKTNLRKKIEFKKINKIKG
jgi:2-polyprenyl-3-methyl-5-hydroxy-6-metoxy-1,4-benzoquinol methylase